MPGEARFEVTQGSSATLRLFIEGERGGNASGVAGNEAVSAAIGRGDGTPALLQPSAQWDATALPSLAVLVSLSTAQTASLSPGNYRVFLTVGQVTRPAAWLVVEPGIGSASRPSAYLAASEWRVLARPILTSVGSSFDDGMIDAAGARAREDLDGELCERYAASFQGRASDASDARARMAAWLAAGGLTITPQVKRYALFRAAWYLLAFQPGAKDNSLPLARVVERLEAESSSALRGLVAYVAGSGGTVRVAMGGQVRVER